MSCTLLPENTRFWCTSAAVAASGAKNSALPALVRDLRCHGWTNVLATGAPPVSRTGLIAALQAFAEAAEPDGKTPERFEIVYLSGWAPSPDQPKPARRGSATASLAGVLGKPKQD